MRKKRLQVAFFGSSLVSAYWNGAATYYRGIIKALDKKGYQVTFYEPDAYDRQKNRDMADPDYARVVVYENSEKAVNKAIDEALRADILIKASGVGVFDELLERELLRRSNSNQQVIFWDVDAPATLDRVLSNPKDPFRGLIPQYDHILTYGGGDPVISKYLSLGAKDCTPVYNALDPETHHPDTPSSFFACDLAFLGNRLPDREKRVEEFFLHVAEALPERFFILGGSGWGDKRMPKNMKYMGHVGTFDHNSFNCTPMAVLNISRDSMASYGFSPATRVFEAAGAGACIITDYWVGIEQFLEPGKEILVARNGKEVAAILENLTPQQAHSIGQAARKRVLAEHTYDYRAKQLEQILVGKHSLTLKEAV